MSPFAPFVRKGIGNSCHLFHLRINGFFFLLQFLICLFKRIILCRHLSKLLIWDFLLRCKLFLIFILKVSNLIVVRNLKVSNLIVVRNLKVRNFTVVRNLKFCNLIVMINLYSCKKLKKVIRLGVWLFFFIELGLNVIKGGN